MKLVLDSPTSHAHTVVSIVGNDLSPYINILRKVADSSVYMAPESSINLPFDEAALVSVESVVAQ